MSASVSDVAAAPDAVLRVGVRELAAFAFRRGDLERAPAGPTARDGQLAHRRLQDEACAVDPAIEVERLLSREVVVRERTLQVVGRIDLLDRAHRRLVEIKSTLVPLARLPPGRRVLDRAQLALYAWMWAPLEAVELELLYVNLRSGSHERDVWSPDPQQLERDVNDALLRWLEHRLTLERREAALRRTAATLGFPMPAMRSGQRRIAVASYRAIRDGGALMVQAPTGTGKTLGTLFPAVRALGEGRVARLRWLTAKRSGREAALDALARLIDRGLCVDALVLRSRRDACRCEREPRHRLDDGGCPHASGFHDRLPAARAEAIGDGSSARLLDGDALDAIAEHHRLCAHALADELLPDATVVIADYNHLFDPIAARDALVDTKLPAALLVDEAHHLPERGRAMWSARLSRLDCLDARHALAGAQPTLAREFGRLADAMRALHVPSTDAVKKMDDSMASGVDDVRVSETACPSLQRALGRLVERLADLVDPADVAGVAGERGATPLLEPDLSIALHRAHVIAGQLGTAHRQVVHSRRIGKRLEVVVEWLCLDAAEPIGRALARPHAALLFSAALGPVARCREALGLDDAARALTVDSPFDPERLHAQLIEWIPVAWRERERSEAALIELIATASATRSGHWIVFLPSHAWASRLHERFVAGHPGRECWRQSDASDASQVQRRLDRLDRPGATLGFAITGGVFGEGVDYVGGRLVGAIVVGLGLPGRDVRTDLMVNFHRERGQDGYERVCRLPALQRTLQSGGRVIRAASDRGALLLVDARFADGWYRQQLPSHWTALSPSDLEDSRDRLTRFWAQPARDSLAAIAPAVTTNASDIEGCRRRSGQTASLDEP